MGCKKVNQPTSLPKTKALLATKFEDFEDFLSVVDITYENIQLDSAIGTVKLVYQDEGQMITSKLSDGITQGEITSASKGDLWDKILLSIQSPYAVLYRKELSQIFMLARRRDALFGENDVAFYDLAKTAMEHIERDRNAFSHYRDSLEKGYINTFNHVTAQALITALYSEELAHFVASVHERFHMPQLVSGKFSSQQLNDTLNYPLDNYVDIINNEIGQELGKYLKYKYHIDHTTVWTPDFTCQFIEEIHNYYEKSFDIVIKSFHPYDELIQKFSHKIEAVKQGGTYY